MTAAVFKPVDVFDRDLLRRRRDRACRAKAQAGADFLLREVADVLLDRLSIIKKEFPVVLDLGGASGLLSAKIKERPGTQHVFMSDMSPVMARYSPVPALVAEEDFLPVRAHSLSAVVSNLSLQWVNDVPGALAQIFQALAPDGLFLCAVLGGETLRELRASLMEAEIAVTGGASPRVSPFIDMRDMGGLLQRAGFALPVIDSETISIDYQDPFRLMKDLRAMGAANALHTRLRIPTRRRVIMEMARIYREKFASPEDASRVTATFDVVYAIGWKPHESQQQPQKPGSAVVRLAEILKSSEKKA